MTTGPTLLGCLAQRTERCGVARPDGRRKQTRKANNCVRIGSAHLVLRVSVWPSTANA